MQLLETNGIDIQLPKEKKKYSCERMNELITEYLEYYKYELREAYLCDYLQKEIQWFCDEYSELIFNVKVYLNSTNTLFTELKTETGQMLFVLK